MRVPLVVNSDIEALLLPRRKDQAERVLNNHQAVSIGYYAKFDYYLAEPTYVCYHQKNASEKSPIQSFAEQLITLAEVLQKTYKNIKPLHLTAEQEKSFQDSVMCHVCKKHFIANS